MSVVSGVAVLVELKMSDHAANYKQSVKTKGVLVNQYDVPSDMKKLLTANSFHSTVYSKNERTGRLYNSTVLYNKAKDAAS